MDGTINTASVDLDLVAGGIQNTFSNAGGGWSVASSGSSDFYTCVGLHWPMPRSQVTELMIMEARHPIQQHCLSPLTQCK